MSLRKSPELTPKLLAAARQNAQHSTGPRSPAAKQNSKLNALKHGQRASPENHHQVMLALGEDPQEFEDLKQELMTAYGPGDALWERQIDDLARLYWRRERLERAQEGLMRRALLGVEEWQHRRQQEMAGATFVASQSQAIDSDMAEPTDPGVRLRMLLSFLGVIRAQVKQRTFKARQASEIQCLYQNQEGWRQARLCHLLRLFNDSFGPEAARRDPELEEILRDEFDPREPAGEPQYQELLRLLDEEIAYVQEEFQYAEKVNEEKAAIERDAALAPVGEEWRTMVRQQGALDRSIDRKVRILLAMRKELPTGGLPSVPSNGDNDPNMARIDKTVEAPGACHSRQACAPRKLGSGNPSSCGLTWTPALRQAQGRLYAGVTTTHEKTKMNERRTNVVENKEALGKTGRQCGNLIENKALSLSIRECYRKERGLPAGCAGLLLKSAAIGPAASGLAHRCRARETAHGSRL
jgi:hypothetical protein